MQRRRVRILGTGEYLPSQRVRAEDIDAQLGLPMGTSERRTGVQMRRWAVGERASHMGAKAARVALDAAGVEFDQIDAIISASGTYEQPVPCTAALIKHALDCSDRVEIAAFDVNLTCLSFVVALDVSASLIDSGRYKRVLIVSTEVASVGVNWDHLESAALFGDGAAAAVVGLPEPGEPSAILAATMEIHSEGVDLCAVPAGGTGLPPAQVSDSRSSLFKFHMDGPRVHRLMARALPPFFQRLTAAARLSISDVALVIPHQASLASLTLMRRRLGIPESKWMATVKQQGNTIAASIPLALHAAISQGRLRRGELAMLVGTSAGLAIGGVVLAY